MAVDSAASVERGCTRIQLRAHVTVIPTRTDESRTIAVAPVRSEERSVCGASASEVERDTDGTVVAAHDRGVDLSGDHLLGKIG